MPEVFPYSYRVFKFDLAPGLVDIEVAIDAEKIVYVSPTDGPEVQIRLQLQRNDQLPLRPNGEIRAPFQRFYLSSPAVGRTIFLMVGSPGDIQVAGRDVAISGSINTLSAWEDHCRNGRAWIGDVSVAPSAGQRGKIQLFNPVASGKTVLLFDYRLISTVAITTDAEWRTHNAALGTNQTTKRRPFLIGGPAPSAQVNLLADATNLGTQFENFESLAANTEWPPVLRKNIIVIPEGQGFHYNGLAVGGQTERVKYFWAEI
jgi:hypothetical protein